MSLDYAIETIRQAVILTLIIAGPLLVTSLLVGVFVSLIQAVTQIQEQTLTFVPKLLILGAMFLILLPWMIGRLVEFLTVTFVSLGYSGF
ncbi:MAG: flagellar biosynthetic protein FliQ [Candidatus Eisenbacteria bacterium]|uniref:Flagellar biosynthetic protein FliQ n=1 Tax=Eiseniibacteriota bacterium TaxID=2212470 RepID=A0A7Y2H188_UNCEI|nr:flagellar biosynthetic protein FliQ [Candidatus Eisenbacteria bacterium]